MSAKVIGGLPWSLPGSRIFGLISETVVNVYSAEYEKNLAASSILKNITPLSSNLENTVPKPVSYGVIDWNSKLALAFLGLAEFELINTSSEAIEFKFEIAGKQIETNSFQLENTEIGIIELFSDSGKLTISGSTVIANLSAGSRLALVVSKSGGIKPSAKDGLAFSAETWLTWMNHRPKVADWIQEAVDTAWYCLGVNAIHLRWQPASEKLAIVPSVLGYVGVWQWDAYFISLGLRHGDADLAKQQLELVFGFPEPSGQLPDVIHDFGRLAAFADLPKSELESYAKAKGLDSKELSQIPITKPPLAAWAAVRLVEATGEKQLYSSLWETLVRAHEWWWSTASYSKHQLPCYQHPYSSGLDDSPSFDDFQVASPPDLLAYLLLDGHLLQSIAEEMGFEYDFELLWKRQEILSQALEAAWVPEAGGYKTYIETGFNDALTVQSLMPLLNELPQEQVVKLLKDIQDPDVFGGELSIPTVARRDKKYSAKDMWRGPVWANTNLLVIEGLQRQGLSKQAKELAMKTIELIKRNGGSFEYYDSETGKPAERAVACFSWTAAVLIDLAVRFTGEESSKLKETN